MPPAALVGDGAYSAAEILLCVTVTNPTKIAAASQARQLAVYPDALDIPRNMPPYLLDRWLEQWPSAARSGVGPLSEAYRVLTQHVRYQLVRLLGGTRLWDGALLAVGQVAAFLEWAERHAATVGVTLSIQDRISAGRWCDDTRNLVADPHVVVGLSPRGSSRIPAELLQELTARACAFLHQDAVAFRTRPPSGPWSLKLGAADRMAPPQDLDIEGQFLLSCDAIARSVERFLSRLVRTAMSVDTKRHALTDPPVALTAELRLDNHQNACIVLRHARGTETALLAPSIRSFFHQMALDNMESLSAATGNDGVIGALEGCYLVIAQNCPNDLDGCGDLSGRDGTHLWTSRCRLQDTRLFVCHHDASLHPLLHAMPLAFTEGIRVESAPSAGITDALLLPVSHYHRFSASCCNDHSHLASSEFLLPLCPLDLPSSEGDAWLRQWLDRVWHLSDVARIDQQRPSR